MELLTASELELILSGLKKDKLPQWGSMSAMQMLLHLTEAIKMSNSKFRLPLVSKEEDLPKMKGFLMSDKEFPKNFKAPMAIPFEEDSDLSDIVSLLIKELNDFHLYYKNNPLATEIHPIFGNLNYEEWKQCHNKHLKHHLQQFELL